MSEEVQTTLLNGTLYEYGGAADARLSNDHVLAQGAVGPSAAQAVQSPIRDRDIIRLRAALERLRLDSSFGSDADTSAFGESIVHTTGMGSYVSARSSVRGVDAWADEPTDIPVDTLGESTASTGDIESPLVGLGGTVLTRTTSMRSDVEGDSVQGVSVTMHTDQPNESVIGLLRQFDMEDGHWLAADNEGLVQAIRRVMQMSAVLAGARLTDEEIRALPKVRFDQADEQQCSICLETFRTGDFLTELPCTHFFHVGCVARWFCNSTQCPLCRSPCGERGIGGN